MKSEGEYFSIQDLIVYILLFFMSNTFSATIWNVICDNMQSDPVRVLITNNLISLAYVPAFVILLSVSIYYRRMRTSKDKNTKISDVFFQGKLNIKTILYGVLAIFAVSIITEPLQSMFPEHMIIYENTFRNADPYLTFITVVIIAPILEELFFRGILLNDASMRWGEKKAVVITSVTFAVLHFSLIQSIPAFFSGLILGLVYIKTQRGLINVLILHTINNLFAFVYLKGAFKEIEYVNSIIGDGLLYWFIYTISIVVLILFYFYGFRGKKKI